MLGHPSCILGLSIASILMVFNYGLETLKWKKFLSQPLYSFGYHFKALLSGSAISLFLPFRSGEFLGRILFFPKRLWGRVILSSVRSGMFQLLLTIVVGVVCLLFVNLEGILTLNNKQIIIISILLLVLVILIIRYLETIVTYILRVGNIKLRVYKGKIMYDTGILLSALRYAVFLVQYALVFWAFNVATLEMVLLWVPVYFLIQTVVPTIFITEMGLRAALCFIIFENSEALIPILAIYLINIIVPAVLGTLFIRSSKA